jgi:hypothetical protein
MQIKDREGWMELRLGYRGVVNRRMAGWAFDSKLALVVSLRIGEYKCRYE